MIYCVTYRIPDGADMVRADTINALETEATLEQIRENCRAFECRADLFNSAGFAVGWVHADGGYSLS